MQTLKDERQVFQPVEPVGGFHEAEPENAHIAFAIVFLGTCALIVGGMLWLIVG